MSPVRREEGRKGKGEGEKQTLKKTQKSIQNRGAQGEGKRKGKGGGERQTVKKTQNQNRIGERKGKEEGRGSEEERGKQ